MITRSEAARRLVWVWLPPLLFVALAIGALAIYATFFAGRVDALETAYERAGDDLEALRDDARRLDGVLERVDGQKADIDTLYRDYFGTEAQRFTTSVRELRRLARQADLDPSSFGYQEEELEEDDLERREISFAVDGTYDQLRTFINLLELTEGFFVLEQVGLGGSSSGRSRRALTIQLRVSTLFVDPASLPAPLEPDLAEAIEVDEDEAVGEPLLEIPVEEEET